MKTILFLIAAVFSVYACIDKQQTPQGNKQQTTQITSQEAMEMLNTQDSIIVLDVRTAGEFLQGHIKGSLNMDINQPDFNTKIEGLDKNGTYIVLCRTHNRSTLAIKNMEQKGFKHMYQMSDGFSGWSLNALPVEK
jgi:phage shock protein E